MSKTNTKPVASKAPPKKQLSPASLKLAEHARTCYWVVVEKGTSLQDVVNSSFWAHNAKKLRLMDHIEVISDDLTWYAELVVLHVEDPVVKVKPLNFVALAKSGESMGELDAFEEAKDRQGMDAKVLKKYKIEHVLSKGWCVRLDAIGSEWIGGEHASQLAAQKWVTEHEKTMRR